LHQLLKFFQEVMKCKLSYHHRNTGHNWAPIRKFAISEAFFFISELAAALIFYSVNRIIRTVNKANCLNK